MAKEFDTSCEDNYGFYDLFFKVMPYWGGLLLLVTLFNLNSYSIKFKQTYLNLLLGILALVSPYIRGKKINRVLIEEDLLKIDIRNRRKYTIPLNQITQFSSSSKLHLHTKKYGTVEIDNTRHKLSTQDVKVLKSIFQKHGVKEI